MNTNEQKSIIVKESPSRKTHNCDREKCSQSFSRAFQLKRHIKAHEKGTLQKSQQELFCKKIYKCDKPGCNEAFTRKWSLKVHKQRIHKYSNNITEHSDEKQYKCEEPDCEAAFNPSDELQAHKLSPRCVERPFKCDYQECNKTYGNASHLKRHQVTRHSLSKDTSQYVICNRCGIIYCNKYVLKQHTAIAHRKQEDGKSNGIKKRSDIEKRHRCEEPGCSAAFSRPYRLINHKLTVHGGQRPFQCDYEGCDKRYSSGSHLARHKSLSHDLEDGVCSFLELDLEFL